MELDNCVPDILGSVKQKQYLKLPIWNGVTKNNFVHKKKEKQTYPLPEVCLLAPWSMALERDLLVFQTPAKNIVKM